MQNVYLMSMFFPITGQCYTCIDLVANSTPMVDLDSKLNSFLVNLESKFDFPTPESPIKTTEMCTFYLLFGIKLKQQKIKLLTDDYL